MRHLSPIRHPYLFGGGISGALIAFAVAAFISMTAVVSQTQLPGGPQSLLTSHPGTLTISGGAGIAQAGTAAETGTSATASAGSVLGAPASATSLGLVQGRVGALDHGPDLLVVAGHGDPDETGDRAADAEGRQRDAGHSGADALADVGGLPGAGAAQDDHELLPPKRAGVSSARTEAMIAAATLRSTTSPVACP